MVIGDDARLPDGHVPLAAAALVGVERQFDAFAAEVPVTDQQREVALLGPAFAELPMEVAQRGPVLRNDQATAGLAVQTVYKVELTIVGTRGAQCLDQAVTHAAATVNGDTGRLVEDDQIVVLVENRADDQRLQVGRCRTHAVRRSPPHRRQPNPIAFHEALRGLGALAVDAHLAFAQQPVDVRPRYALEHAQQEIVESLASVPGTGFDIGHRLAASLGRGFGFALAS